MAVPARADTIRLRPLFERRAGHTGLHWRPPGRAWPLWVITAGMPFMFLLGLQGLAWAAPGAVFGLTVFTSKARFPRRAGWLALFLVWMVLAATMLTPAEWPLFAYRSLLFGGALACLGWIANEPEERTPTPVIVSWLASLWIVCIACGYLALVLPSLNALSPFQRLTGGFGRIQFIDDISRWRFTQYETGRGLRLPRPSAPFAFTNGWGAAVALLTPYFAWSWLVAARGRRRKVGMLLMVLAVPPVMVSGNRGVWISVCAALLYWTARQALRRDFRPLGALVAMAVVVAVIFVVTPAGTLFSERLKTSDRSTESRGSIYEAAWQGTLRSPLLGNAKPEQITDSTLPPIGTHGLLWYLMYVHGFVGLGLFLLWLGSEVVHSGRRITTPDRWWAHLPLVIAAIQMPYYGMQPQVVLFGVAAGIAIRVRAPAAEAASAEAEADARASGPATEATAPA